MQSFFVFSVWILGVLFMMLWIIIFFGWKESSRLVIVEFIWLNLSNLMIELSILCLEWWDY